MSSLRSDNMQGLLQLLFCFVLLAKGKCLQCETCKSNTTSCTGPKENCTAEDTCIIAIAKSTLVGKVAQYNFAKSCGSLSDCSVNQRHFDLGNGRLYQFKRYCCKEDCSKVTATLPTLEKDPQGKRCPSCHSKGEPCKKETVECSGKDSECFTATVNTTSNGKETKHIMKGCGSSDACVLFDTGVITIVEEGKASTQVKCILSGASQILASFLTTFYSLWILKLLV